MKKFFLICQAFIFIISIFLVGCKSGSLFLNQSFINNNIEYQVSESNLTCASASEMVKINNDLYNVYLSSYENHGESRDLIVLSCFNVDNPQLLETFIVAENGSKINDILISYPYEPNIFLFDSFIRIFFLNRSFSKDMYYMYRDFDIINKEFIAVGKMQINYGNKILDFNLQNYELVLNNENIEYYKDESLHPIFTSRIIDVGDKKMGVVTAPSSYPIVVSSTDGFATLNIMFVIREISQFECAIEFDGYNYYVLLRNRDRNLLIYDNEFTLIKTYSIQQSLTRGQLYLYNGIIYVFYSDNSTKGITCERNNMIIGLLDIYTFEFYPKVAVFENQNGIVYYSVILNDNSIFYVYSTTTLFVNNEGKDSIIFNKLEICNN